MRKWLCRICNRYRDCPEWDNTPYAHPAFYRGQDSGVEGACNAIEAVLDGKDDGAGVYTSDHLERVRRRLLKIMVTLGKELENAKGANR